MVAVFRDHINLIAQTQVPQLPQSVCLRSDSKRQLRPRIHIEAKIMILLAHLDDPSVSFKALSNRFPASSSCIRRLIHSFH